MLRTSRHGDVLRFDCARSIAGTGHYWTSAYLVDGLMIDTGSAHCAGELCQALSRMPVIESSVWRAGDGALGLVFTNWTDSEQSILYEFRLADYELTPGSYVLSQIDASGTTPVAGG